MPNQLLKKLNGYLKENNQIETIYGNFNIGKQLGQGGTSLVKEATFQEKKFAIKFLLENISQNDSRAFKRFKQAHLNLLELVGSGCILPQYHMDTISLDENIKLPYVIMPCADGTLKDYLRDLQTKDFSTFKQIFDSLLDCLETIHSAGITHRDIKPENIFLYKERLVIGDFDIAKFDDPEAIRLHRTEQGERLANYLFSAPEQSQKQFDEITPAADLYAFGQILYWYLTEQTLRGLSHLHFPEIEDEYKPYLPIIRTLLADAPEHRYSSVSEIRNAVKDFIKKTEKDPEWEQIHAVCAFEDDIVCKYGSAYGNQAFVREISNPNMIEEVMNDLSIGIDLFQLWWAMGTGNLHISSIENLQDNEWLIDGIELNIKRLWLYRGIYGGGTSFLALELYHSEGTGLYPEAIDLQEEEYAINEDGTLITRPEFDNGYFEREGLPLKVVNPKLRLRYLKDNIMFIAPHSGPLYENYSAFYSLYKNYDPTNINESFFEELGTLNRTDAMKKYD